jgi:hypothetical protein
MTTNLPISNESMARAILRRTLRESPQQQRRALAVARARYAPTRRRRGPVFRSGVSFMDRCLAGRMLKRSVSGKGKASRADWVFLEVLGDPPRPVISAATLDARHDRIMEAELVRVSQHALQRLFQRLRTDEPTAALLEVLPAATRAAEQGVEDVSGQQDSGDTSALGPIQHRETRMPNVSNQREVLVGASAQVERVYLVGGYDDAADLTLIGLEQVTQHLGLFMRDFSMLPGCCYEALDLVAAQNLAVSSLLDAAQAQSSTIGPI